MKHPPHQHLWTTTSPVQCVECKRHLLPSWRRLRIWWGWRWAELRGRVRRG